jgi:hypothetical protein
MKLIQELTDTTTSTTSVSELFTDQWKLSVIQYSSALKKFDQCVQINTDLVKSNDRTLHIPIASSNMTIVSTFTEGSDRNFTELSGLDTVDVTIISSDFKMGGIAITKMAVMSTQVDIIKQARYQLAEAMSQESDLAIRDMLCTDSTGTTSALGTTNRVYGGTATAVSGVADGDVMTVDHVADAMAKLESNNWVPKWLYVAPAQIQAFRKNSQFVNAAEYGSDRVIQRGEIGDYLGVAVIVTSNCTSYAKDATDKNEGNLTWAGLTSATGRVCPMVGTNKVGEKVAGVLAWKEMPHLDYEYYKPSAEHRLYYDQAFKCAILQKEAICLIKVSNS